MANETICEKTRQELYDAGLSDKEIAMEVGASVTAIASWRQYRKLKANKYAPPDTTLCWDCQNTHKDKCSWFNPDDPRPVKGWNATPTVNRYRVGRNEYETHSYHVIDCPNYKPMEGKTND